MNETYYLFKRAADGIWIFGENTDCEHLPGTCRVIPSTDRTKVSIIYFQKNEANLNKFNIPFGNILDESGTAYASFAALKAAYKGFFSTNSKSIQVVDLNGNVVYFTGKPVKTSCEFTRPADILDYAAYDSIAHTTSVTDALLFDLEVALTNGGGGVVELVKLEAPAKWAGLTFLVPLYKSTPSALYGDNVPFVYDTANSLIRIGVVEVEMGPVINGSSVVFGQTVCYLPYVCASDAKTIKAMLVTKSAVVAPTSAGKFSLGLTCTIQA